MIWNLIKPRLHNQTPIWLLPDIHTVIGYKIKGDPYGCGGTLNYPTRSLIGPYIIISPLSKGLVSVQWYIQYGLIQYIKYNVSQQIGSTFLV